MVGRRGSGRVARLAAGLAVLAGATAVGGTAPAAATPADSDTLVFVAPDSAIVLFRNGTSVETDAIVDRADRAFVGDLSAAQGTSVFLYNPGRAPDAIVDVGTNDDGDETGVGYGVAPEAVSGTYTPLVGDFDGNGVDDVLWYAPGAAPDTLWLYRGLSARTATPLSISGSYQPVVLDADADGRDDILWYAPGPAADSLWTFGPNAVPTKRTVRIDGRYDVVVGRFGDAPEGEPQDRIAFSDPTGPDAIWTFDTQGRATSRPASFPPGAPVVGDLLGTGRDSILWYRPGSATESLTRFDVGGSPTTVLSRQVTGTYAPVVGDLDGNGYDDIAWTSGGRATIWQHAAGGITQRSVDSGLGPSIALVSPDADELPR